MRRIKCNTAFTLIEMLVVVAIIAILVTIVISTAARLDAQSRINLTQGTFRLLNTALSEFHDYGLQHPNSQYASIKFPIDCNGFSKSDLESALSNAIPKAATVSITRNPDDLNFSGTEAMYFLLSQIPQCSQTLEKINSKIIIRDGEIDVTDTGGTISKYPLIHINDAWGKPLRYDYYDELLQNINVTKMVNERRNFPVITSAGPDGKFDTADDIKNR